jgi:hypothetical protein
MGCRYHPAPCQAMNEPRRKHLPAHMVAGPHERHDEQHGEYDANVQRQDEHQSGNDDRAGKRFPRMKAHRSPGRGRAAGMVHPMDRPEEQGVMHRPVRPVEPRVVYRQAQQERDRQPPKRIVAGILVYPGPAQFTPTPGDKPCRRSVDDRPEQRPFDFAAHLRFEPAMHSGRPPLSQPCEKAARRKIARCDNCDHRHDRQGCSDGERGKHRLGLAAAQG